MNKPKISVVVNTYNEEVNLSRCLESVRHLVDELVVVDMRSTDKTVEIAKKFGAKVFEHEYVGFVESARNFALSQSKGDWILIIDADEELPKTLLEKLKKITEEDKADYVVIPRKNIIFGKWLKYSRWWPDYNVRFFKKGKVTWSNKIHSIPQTIGEGMDLEAKEENAIIHYNYSSIGQYLERNNRYSEVMAKELVTDGYQFCLADLIKKPTDEFLSRYFAGEGYKDGIHGLVLALLQGFVEFLTYAKVWEKQGYKEEKIDSFPELAGKSIKDFNYWLAKTSNFGKKLQLKIKSLI